MNPLLTFLGLCLPIQIYDYHLKLVLEEGQLIYLKRTPALHFYYIANVSWLVSTVGLSQMKRVGRGVGEVGDR